jgi:hypothetical protein
MIVYNITINVEEDVHEEWLEWMTTKHIPDVMNTGCFKDSKIFHMLIPEPEEGETYVVQYFCESIEDYERYQIENAAMLQSEHKERFKGSFTSFRTVMEQV